MDEGKLVSSFVLRFSRMNVDGEKDLEPLWRIKVTHVQGNDEIIVGSMEQAMQFIDRIMERG